MPSLVTIQWLILQTGKINAFAPNKLDELLSRGYIFFMYMRGNPLGELLYPILVKNNCRKKNILVTGRIIVKKSGRLLENKISVREINWQ